MKQGRTISLLFFSTPLVLACPQADLNDSGTLDDTGQVPGELDGQRVRCCFSFVANDAANGAGGFFCADQPILDCVNIVDPGSPDASDIAAYCEPKCANIVEGTPFPAWHAGELWNPNFTVYSGPGLTELDSCSTANTIGTSAESHLEGAPGVCQPTDPLNFNLAPIVVCTGPDYPRDLVPDWERGFATSASA